MIQLCYPIISGSAYLTSVSSNTDIMNRVLPDVINDDRKEDRDINDNDKDYKEAMVKKIESCIEDHSMQV